MSAHVGYAWAGKTCRADQVIGTLERVSIRSAVMAAALVTLVMPALATAKPFAKGPYLQNVSKSSVTVMWESTHTVPGTVVLLGDSPQTLVAPPDSIHEITIDGLAAGRRYRYRVECEGDVREGEFATAPESNAPFSFVVFGDSRTNVGSHRRVVERIRREVPDFILGTGDMVDDGARDMDWQIFFDVESELLGENVLFPSIGNHDRQGRGRTADNYRKYFSLPENSPDPERYYAFTYGNARFLILDSNAYSFALTDQTAWIERQLGEARLDREIAHIFVSMHHPPFSISLHGGQTELRDAWTPLFERYGVAAVFSGHDHCYSRSQSNGVHYIVSGGGGAPLYPRSRKPSKIDVDSHRYFERVNHYVRVHVIGNFIEMVALRADGSLMETLSWGALPEVELEPAVGAGDEPERARASEAVPAERRVTASVGQRKRSRGSGGASGFGFLGVFGGIMVLLAGGVLFWSLRR